MRPLRSGAAWKRYRPSSLRRAGNANSAEVKQQKALDDAVKFLRVIAKAGAPVIEGLRLA